MKTIKNILFPVDFSPASVAMAPFVRREAALFAATVTVLHVIEPSSSGFEFLVRPAPEIEQDLKLVAREKLNEFLQSAFAGRGCQRIVRTGDAATQIVEAAREHGVDLIIMPSHADGFRRMLFGSTTAKVLNSTECPVLTTLRAESISPRRIDHREWICVIGLQPDSESILRHASQLAETVSANLTVIDVLPIRAVSLSASVRSAENQQTHYAVERMQQAAAPHGQVRVVIGPIETAVPEAARRMNADALVIGRTAPVGVRLKDRTYAMVSDAPCPVLSV